MSLGLPWSNTVNLDKIMECSPFRSMMGTLSGDRSGSDSGSSASLDKNENSSSLGGIL